MVSLGKAKSIGTKHIAAIDPVELACRLLEAAGKLKRPEGLTALQAFLSIEKEDQDRWMAAATAAMEYWRECIQDMKQTN